VRRHAGSMTARVAIASLLLYSALTPAETDTELAHHDHAPLPVDETLTMTAAVDDAFARYPMTVELSARSDQADAWKNRGKSWLANRPSVMVRYQTDRWGQDNGLDEYEAGISLPLWNWGGRKATQSLGDALAVETGAADHALRWEVAGLLRNALWEIALAENERDLTQQALDTAARLTATVTRRYELGDVAMGDVLLAQSSHLESQTQLIAATASLLDAERAYRSVTGLERRPRFQGETLSGLHDVEADHPALVFANAELARAEAALDVAERSVRTGTSLMVGPRSERAPFDDEFEDSFGISLNIPFGGSAHRRSEISAAVRVAARARAIRDMQMRTLTLALHEAAHGLSVVRESLAAASERLDLAQRYLTLSNSAYEKGELEMIDLLKVQATAIAAKRQVTRLVIDEKRQTARYNHAVGVLP